MGPRAMESCGETCHRRDPDGNCGGPHTWEEGSA